MICRFCREARVLPLKRDRETLRFLALAGQGSSSAQEAAMKVNIEFDMTPEEARRMMGLPDVTRVQDEMMKEFQARAKAAMDTSDPDAMLKAWLPMGAAPAFELFQKMLLDNARAVAADAKREPGMAKQCRRATRGFARCRWTPAAPGSRIFAHR